MRIPNPALQQAAYTWAAEATKAHKLSIACTNNVDPHPPPLALEMANKVVTNQPQVGGSGTTWFDAPTAYAKRLMRLIAIAMLHTPVSNMCCICSRSRTCAEQLHENRQITRTTR